MAKYLHKKLLIILVLFLALGLRLIFLNGSFWLDEAAQALESQRSLSAQFDIAADFQPPLIHLLVHFALYVSRQEWWLRLIAALIPGLITIWTTYEIGLVLFKKTTAQLQETQFLSLAASLLLTTSSFHLFYSQELRPYSLPAMWATLSWLVLLKFDFKKHISWTIGNLKLKLNRSLVYFTLLTILGIYSSYLYPFLILGQLVFVFWLNKKLIKPLLLSLIIAGLSYLPWLPSFFNQLQTGQSWRTILPGWDKVVSIPPLKSLFLVIGKFLYGVIDLAPTPFIVLSLGLLLILSLSILLTASNKFGAIKNVIKPAQGQLILTLLIWLVIPLLTAWLVSLIVPVLRPKRVLYLMPPFYLTAVASYLITKRQLLAKILIGLLLIINIYGVTQYYFKPRLQREDWRQLHQTISDRYSPATTTILFSFPHGFAPWDWYEQTNQVKFPQLTTGALHIDQAINLKQRLKPVADYEYTLLFDYLRDLSDPNDELSAYLQQAGLVEIGAIDQTNIGFVRVFAHPSRRLSQN